QGSDQLARRVRRWRRDHGALQADCHRPGRRRQGFPERLRSPDPQYFACRITAAVATKKGEQISICSPFCFYEGVSVAVTVLTLRGRLVLCFELAYLHIDPVFGTLIELGHCARPF